MSDRGRDWRRGYDRSMGWATNLRILPQGSQGFGITLQLMTTTKEHGEQEKMLCGPFAVYRESRCQKTAQALMRSRVVRVFTAAGNALYRFLNAPAISCSPCRALSRREAKDPSSEWDMSLLWVVPQNLRTFLNLNLAH